MSWWLIVLIGVALLAFLPVVVRGLMAAMWGFIFLLGVIAMALALPVAAFLALRDRWQTYRIARRWAPAGRRRA